MSLTMAEIQNIIGKWHYETFGCKQTSLQIIKHLEEEVKELRDSLSTMDSRHEASDVFILLCGICNREGFDLETAVAEKMAINRARTWHRPDEAGISRHVEECPKTTKLWVIRFPEPTPSENTIRGHHWRKVRQDKIETAWKFKAALLKHVAIPKADGFRKVHIIRYGPGVLDTDNMAGGAKALIDAIKGERLIVDDSPKHCHLEFSQTVCRKDPHTIIVIEETS